MRSNFKPEYIRYLPYFQRPGMALFIAFRLYESLPKHWIKSLIERYQAKRQAILNTKDPDWEATINYIIQNPVKAGFCQHWFEHAFTWTHENAWRMALPLLLEWSF